jgi:hypothetical protein
MELLANKVRGFDYITNEEDKEMSRLSWLNHLSLIFNLALGVNSFAPVASSVATEALLNILIANSKHLPLVPAAQALNSGLRHLSFKQIFQALESKFGHLLSWDQVMDLLMSIKPRTRNSPTHCSLDLNELVYISKVSSIDIGNDNENKEARVGDLRIPQLLSDGEVWNSEQSSVIGTGKEVIKISVQELGETLNTFVQNFEVEGSREKKEKVGKVVYDVPLGVELVDFSKCRLKKIPVFVDVDKIKVMDLRFNAIERLDGCEKLESLQELYIAHNQVTALNELLHCKNLVIIDASYNKIQYFISIASLSSLELKILNLDNNKILKQIGIVQNLKLSFPQLLHTRTKVPFSFTSFPDQEFHRPSKSLIEKMRNL